MEKNIKLSDGNIMPIEGFGTYKLDTQEKMDVAFKAAYKNGYRLFDSAQLYKNEDLLGNSIKKFGVDRENLFITTKIPETKQGYDSTLRAIDESLEKLQTNYLDLLLIHWPIHSKFFETWRALEDAKEAGKVKSIGVSNYHRAHLELLKTQAREMPVVNQIENHPYLSQPALIEYDKSQNIITQAWSPMGRGSVLQDATIKEIAEKHGKSTAQVVLRWHLQRGVAIIPKSKNEQRIKENQAIYDFELSDKEIGMINNLNKNQRNGDDPELVYEIEHQYPTH
ncbi:aldo keto reductase [Apilactobacillus ozensis DSM 23829 = JCM 17196]|uniref:Aldo keto reductase n=1 Tax=Apilactobacillus ozensis DSM 23829 = JCM 17196 TaxID=1423781 RepID=A0A0R2AVZ2_9LACO|nr:aldo/keto reductase [Apilactobacillus ozensis]KRM69700.1 aldo keto reductase [Apilactobacillus ozensis DSM 23829 = JCM 17196]